ncbi:polysaccharide lyase [Litoricolaceae bacterium]|nr:polysaccharide lyase [Litorivicinaceae bacterium]
MPNLLWLILILTTVPNALVHAGNWNKPKVSSLADPELDKVAYVLIDQLNDEDVSVGIDLEPYSDASLRDGRLEITDQVVRSGEKALKLSIYPGDCGQSWPVIPNGWNDCDHGNERIGVNEETLRLGEWYYTASLYLDEVDFAKKSVSQTHVNLMQWLDQDANNGPPFNVMWFPQNQVPYLKLPQTNFPDRFLVIDHRLKRFAEKDPSGNQAWSPMKLIAADEPLNNATGRWLDFAVFANWTSRDNGWFIVAMNGAIVFDYRGQTVEESSKGVAFDVQLYRYGRGDLKAQRSGPIRGDHKQTMFVDNLGVFKAPTHISESRPPFRDMAKLLTKQAKEYPIEPASFQPPAVTNRTNVNERYEGCPLTVRCIQR